MKADVESQMSQLPRMETSQLRRLWREVFGKPPHPKLRRELIIPIVAYRLQEKEFGGLKQSTLRRLQEVREGRQRSKGVGPMPGTRIVRQWQGRVHEVEIVEDGFMYDGRKFGSLSEIARTITGTRWSGPAFFGLKNRTGKEAK